MPNVTLTSVTCDIIFESPLGVVALDAVELDIDLKAAMVEQPGDHNLSWLRRFKDTLHAKHNITPSGRDVLNIIDAIGEALDDLKKTPAPMPESPASTTLTPSPSVPANSMP